MNEDKVINFMGYRKIAAVLSTLMIIVSIGSLAVQQLRFGLDFTGGTLVEVGYSEAVDLDSIRKTLVESGFTTAVVVNYGSAKDVLVRLQRNNSSTLGNELLAALDKGFDGEIELHRIEFVGPQVGEELREQGGLALLASLLVVLVYVAFRFQFKFALGAVLALAHDVIITLGIFSLFQWEFDLTVLAALLAVIGYSLNDTIVVADRIRENFRKVRKGSAIEIINGSLTQTLERTLLTSLTTMLVLVALALFGGESIRGFSNALLIGIFVGTYSSIFIAANLLITLGITKEDLIVPVKEGEEIDGLP